MPEMAKRPGISINYFLDFARFLLLKFLRVLAQPTRERIPEMRSLPYNIVALLCKMLRKWIYSLFCMWCEPIDIRLNYFYLERFVLLCKPAPHQSQFSIRQSKKIFAGILCLPVCTRSFLGTNGLCKLGILFPCRISCICTNRSHFQIYRFLSGG